MKFLCSGQGLKTTFSKLESSFSWEKVGALGMRNLVILNKALLSSSASSSFYLIKSYFKFTRWGCVTKDLLLIGIPLD